MPAATFAPTLQCLATWCVGAALAGCAQNPAGPGTPPVRPVLPCERLLEASTRLPAGVQLNLAQRQRADTQSGHPAHCLVQGQLATRRGEDGRTYAIGFELRLPARWNGRFLHQAHGGTDGVVKPAFGDLAVLDNDALGRGFAVLSSDGGHHADDPANADAGLARGVVFGHDAQARRDFGHAALDALWPLAQGLLRRHYGQPPRHNYLAGCGNGGRLGLVAASRYPERYDGILAGAPALHWPRAALQHPWDWQVLQTVQTDPRQALSTADMQLVAQQVVARCDGLDMLADGLVADVARCQQAFSPAQLQCRAGGPAACLSAPKVQALAQLFAGPHSPDGQPLYSRWPWDAGLASAGWRRWRLESDIAGLGQFALGATFGAATLAHLMHTPPLPVAGNVPALLAYLQGFDFDRDVAPVLGPAVPPAESATALYSPPDADAPRLQAFAQQRGKLIVYHGASDPAFSLQATLRWAEQLQNHWGLAQADQMARVFAVPGMGHCRGGPATDRFDALDALVNWVENDRAPDRLLARVNPANPDLPTDWSRQRSRPLCPWPRLPRYAGGHTEDAASFRCTAP